MEIGTYRKRPIDWKKYLVDCFRPHLFSSYSGFGCGANTLSLLTGIAPFNIVNPNKTNPNDWTEKFVIRFLKKRGFTVIPFTVCDATNFSSVSGEIQEFLSDNHVLLTVQMLSKNKASWAVMHNKIWYHNFQLYSNTAISILNSPPLKIFVLHHPIWGMNGYEIDKVDVS
mgnify:CR=1 FL=1